jgi:hypothetical protein
MIHPDRILLAVSKAFSIDPLIIWSHSRTRMASYPRMVAAYLMREMTPMTMEDITLYLNRTDHSTAHYWVKTAKQMAGGEPYRSVVNNIIEELTKDEQSSRPAVQLHGQHPILQEGTRHPYRRERLRGILQWMPQVSVSSSDRGVCSDGEAAQTH